MKEQAFYDTINSLVAELHDNCFGVGILYEMCNNKLHPWGNKFRLGDKIVFISRIHKLDIHEGYLRYDIREVEGKQISRHRKVNVFSAIVDMLLESEQFKAFVEKIEAISWQFTFDAGSEDIAHFKESLFAVLEFNDILMDAICRYDKLYDQTTNRNDNMGFSSTFLHFHRPEQFFMFNRNLSRGRIRFRSQNGCRIAEAIIDDEAKSKIEETCQRVLKAMYNDGVLTDEPLNSERVRYIRTMGLQYAICCYVRENSDKIEGLERHPLTLISAEILSHIRKIKSAEELEVIMMKLKPEMPLSEMALYCEDVAEFDQLAEAYKRNKNQ